MDYFQADNKQHRLNDNWSKWGISATARLEGQCKNLISLVLKNRPVTPHCSVRTVLFQILFYVINL